MDVVEHILTGLRLARYPIKKQSELTLGHVGIPCPLNKSPADIMSTCVKNNHFFLWELFT